MGWLRNDDCAYDDPALMSIARTQREADLLLGILTALKLYCAKHTTNGFLPELVVRKHLRGRLLKAFEQAGLLHPAGQVCECQKGIAWPAGMAYHVHDYLKHNPTQDEYDVDRAKRAELKDRELQAAVRRRDRDLCRYCGELTKWADRVGARGLVFDHVDPALANGAANLVVACRSCNSRKNKRTPEAAGMNLLPEPGEVTPPGPDLQSRPDTASDQDTGWSAPQLPPTPTSRPTNGQTYPPTNPVTSEVTNGSDPGRSTSRAGTGRDGTGNRPAAGDAGPGGVRDRTGPAPPRPTSADPDPYRRQAQTGPHPADHAGLPRGPPAGQGTHHPHHPVTVRVLP
jgi:hypothetical protein